MFKYNVEFYVFSFTETENRFVVNTAHFRSWQKRVILPTSRSRSRLAQIGERLGLVSVSRKRVSSTSLGVIIA
jgi:hypothetical protein